MPLGLRAYIQRPSMDSLSCFSENCTMACSYLLQLNYWTKCFLDLNSTDLSRFWFQLQCCNSRACQLKTAKPIEINGLNIDLQRSLHATYLNAIYNNQLFYLDVAGNWVRTNLKKKKKSNIACQRSLFWKEIRFVFIVTKLWSRMVRGKRWWVFSPSNPIYLNGRIKTTDV